MEHGTPTIVTASRGSDNHDVEKSIGVTLQPADSDDGHEEPLTAMQKMKVMMDRLWLLESIGLFVCVCSLMGIVGLLKAYDDKPLPEWKRSGTIHIKNHVRTYDVSITLNAVVSIMATAFKIALGVPVAASLGQLKWVWFSEGQKLADFQTFDSAKGVLGSLTLLWRLRAKRLACLAAVVTLGALAIDFAFQSMITLPILPKSIGLKASVPTSSVYDDYTMVLSGSHLIGSTIDQSMLASIYTGIFDFNRSSLVTPSCPSGSCAWNTTEPEITTYASIGVCGKCQDSSAHLTKQCSTTQAYSADTSTLYNITAPYCNYTLPNGLVLPGTPDLSYTYMTASSSINDITRFTNLSNPFSILSTIRANWTYVYANGTVTDNPDQPTTTDEDGNPLATPIGELYAQYLGGAVSTECALYYCVQSYSGSVVNGTFSEQVLDTYYNDTVGDTSMALNSDYRANEINVTLTVPSSWKMKPNAPRTFTVVDGAWYAAYEQFSNFWNGSAAGIQIAAEVGDTTYSTDVVRTIFQQDSAGVEKVIQNLAQAMTTNMRLSTSQTDAGIAYQFVPYVSVAWRWIALPTVLLFIALVLLISTIFFSTKNGTRLWKTSTLAAFYHPLTEAGRDAVGAARDKTHLDKISEDVHVKWARTEKGWRFVPVEGAEGCKKAR